MFDTVLNLLEISLVLVRRAWCVRSSMPFRRELTTVLVLICCEIRVNRNEPCFTTVMVKTLYLQQKYFIRDVYTLLKIKVLKASSQRCYRRTIFGSTKNHLVKCSVKISLLSFYHLKIFFARTFCETKWFFWCKRFIMKPLRQKRLLCHREAPLFFKSIVAICFNCLTEAFKSQFKAHSSVSGICFITAFDEV